MKACKSFLNYDLTTIKLQFLNFLQKIVPSFIKFFGTLV